MNWLIRDIYAQHRRQHHAAANYRTGRHSEFMHNAYNMDIVIVWSIVEIVTVPINRVSDEISDESTDARATRDKQITVGHVSTVS